MADAFDSFLVFGWQVTVDFERAGDVHQRKGEDSFLVEQEDGFGVDLSVCLQKAWEGAECLWRGGEEQ